jgi:hypothetical protein
MRRVLYLCVAMFACIGGWLAWQNGAAILHRGTETLFKIDPGDGKVVNGTYTNQYFGLTYPLPQGWTNGEPGPAPSQSGYYVLATLIPAAGRNAAIMIAAQDTFFAVDKNDEHGDVADSARDLRQAMSNIEGMTVDPDLKKLKVADHLLYRVDYSGVGLFHATIRTQSRCHILSFNLTARDAELRKSLASSLEKVSFTTRSGAASPPPCVSGYATAGNIVHKVAPLPVGPKFVPIPVRIIVGADGDVKHVHVIRATNDQRRSIEEAVYQWKFKPYKVNGRPSPVETGLVFKFKGDN